MVGRRQQVGLVTNIYGNVIVKGFSLYDDDGDNDENGVNYKFI